MIYEFERQRGLDDPASRPPPSAAKQIETYRMEQLQREAQRARASKDCSVPRGALMSHLDSIWVKSALVRPCTAPARVNQAAAAARRKAEVYDYWLKKHRGEIESHARVVEREYAEEKRIRRERVADRRQTQLDAYRAKAEASRARALERQEPYPMRRDMNDHRTSLLSRQRERAWSQDIVFLPQKLAARESRIVRERKAADYEAERDAVLRLPPPC